MCKVEPGRPLEATVLVPLPDGGLDSKVEEA